MPNTVRFETIYIPGKVEAVSYRGGKEISRDLLQTSRKPAGIRLHPEKTELAADGHDLLYIGIDIVDPEGVVVTDASVTLRAGVSGCAELAGFGTGNPVTDENYTEGETVSYRGHAMAVLPDMRMAQRYLPYREWIWRKNSLSFLWFDDSNNV